MDPKVRCKHCTWTALGNSMKMKAHLGKCPGYHEILQCPCRPRLLLVLSLLRKGRLEKGFSEVRRSSLLDSIVRSIDRSIDQGKLSVN